MDLYTLKLFLHLSETLHFNKTSRACFISPSGLTRSIQRLEDEIGTALFIRDNRKVSLTAAGLRLKTYGTKISETWEQFLMGLTIGEDLLKGNLDIYCSVTASYSILQPVMNRFRDTYPGVHLKLETGEAASAVSRVIGGDTDICITSLPDKLPSGLAFNMQTEIPLVLIAPRTQCKINRELTKKTPWYELPLILPVHGLGRKRINTWLRNNNIKPEIYADVAGNEAIIAMTALGLGIGLVPELVLQESAHIKEVRKLEDSLDLPPYKVGFCAKKSRLKNKLVKAFWEIIQNSNGYS